MSGATRCERELPRSSFLIGEYLTAFRDGFTYRPWENVYGLFGLIWSLPIPVLTVFLTVVHGNKALLDPSAKAFGWHVLLFVLSLLHMPIFAILFGAFGTVRRRKDQRIGQLFDELESRLEELTEANLALQELDQLKDEFTSNLTHELKTPLVSACAYNEMILKGRLGEVTQKQRRGLEVSLRNMKRLQGLIDDMLMFAQIESGSFEYRPAPFELDELLHEMDVTFRGPCAEKGITLEVPGEPLGVKVVADREGVRTVLVNLLSNAVKFTPEEGAIELRAGRVEDRVELEVRDSGLGIAPEAQEIVFQRFRQVEGSRSRRYGGAGLGLAIVKKILDAHEIEITLESCEGEGSTFRFDLPVDPGGIVTQEDSASVAAGGVTPGVDLSTPGAGSHGVHRRDPGIGGVP